MSLTPANDQRVLREAKEAVELCGKNRGPHHYIPIEWSRTETTERVTRLLCITCFKHTSIQNILKNAQEVNYL